MRNTNHPVNPLSPTRQTDFCMGGYGGHQRSSVHQDMVIDLEDDNNAVVRGPTDYDPAAHA